MPSIWIPVDLLNLTVLAVPLAVVQEARDVLSTSVNLMPDTLAPVGTVRVTATLKFVEVVLPTCVLLMSRVCVFSVLVSGTVLAAVSVAAVDTFPDTV